MASWIVRCRYKGQIDVSSRFWQEAVAAISWDDGIHGIYQSLLDFRSRENLAAILREVYPEASQRQRNAWELDLWLFSRQIKPGDLVVTNPSPINRTPVLLGRCTRSYFFEWGRLTGRFEPEQRDYTFPHFIGVEWLREVPHRLLPPRPVGMLRNRSIRTVQDISEYTGELEAILRSSG